MTESLTGHVQGANRNDLLTQATAEAENYFETKDVHVTLRGEARAVTQRVDETTIADRSIATVPTQTIYESDYIADLGGSNAGI